MLLDTHLPGMSGPALLRSLRLAGVLTPVLITSDEDAVSERIAFALGAAGCLLKPISTTSFTGDGRASDRLPARLIAGRHSVGAR
ncbi:MAG: response regulator [Steroidobacteraceae bacterium]